MLVETTHLTQSAYYISFGDVKGIHLCFIMSPGKMICSFTALTVTVTVSFKLISF